MLSPDTNIGGAGWNSSIRGELHGLARELTILQKQVKDLQAVDGAAAETNAARLVLGAAELPNKIILWEFWPLCKCLQLDPNRRYYPLHVGELLEKLKAKHGSSCDAVAAQIAATLEALAFDSDARDAAAALRQFVSGAGAVYPVSPFMSADDLKGHIRAAFVLDDGTIESLQRDVDMWFPAYHAAYSRWLELLAIRRANSVSGGSGGSRNSG